MIDAASPSETAATSLQPRVIVVEKCREVCAATREAARVLEIEAVTCNTVAAGVASLPDAYAACFVVDAAIAFNSDQTLTEAIASTGVDPPIIATGNGAAADRARIGGAWKVLPRPSDVNTLAISMRAGVEESSRRVDDARLVREYRDAVAQLSEDERVVMDGICGGKLNKQLARELGVSIRTIEQRRRRVFSKMKVSSVGPLAATAATVEAIERFRPHLRF